MMVRQSRSEKTRMHGLRAIAPSLRTTITLWLVAVALGILLARTPLDTLALMAGAALALILALVHPVLAVGMAALSVPVQELITLPGGLSVTQMTVLLALGGWLFHTLARAEQRMLPTDLLLLWGGVLFALLLSASVTPYSRTEALRETARWMVAAGVWMAAASTITRRWHIIYLLACLLIAPAVCAGIGIVQFATGDGPPTFRIAPDLPYVRAYGTIGQPNSFAGYLNMAWPLALALAMVTANSARQSGVRRCLAATGRWMLVVVVWGVVGVLLTALMMSFSRGAWIGAAIGVTGMALSLGRRALPALLGLVAVGVAVVLLAIVGALPEALMTRLASVWQSVAWFDAAAVTVTPENFAVVERMAHLQAGWEMFRSAPLFGVGPGNYSVAYPEFAVGGWYASRGHAHNYYLHMAAETGIIGIVAYLALLGGVIRQALRALRRTTDPILYGATVGGCGIIAAVAGHNLFENLHVLNFGIQLAVVWAVIGAIAHCTEDIQSQCAIS
ncbi:O-antigen polymerase [Roseiflexus castenholzii DSM 13941]|jgi:O-antigen ligase|uniref:O-antigen polymerase n=2 Tax=Roseiflexus castenholzii TaxID=120962 RepID=A7NRU9_ROSCS|nr:O-antigen polymerase [Roseiflexus castenholzii DSM 13941]